MDTGAAFISPSSLYTGINIFSFLNNVLLITAQIRKNVPDSEIEFSRGDIF